MAVLSQGGDVGLQFSAGSVEGLRLCSQASLSFSSTLYVAPFVQSWHWNKHTVIRYCYERRKNFVTFSFVKVFLHSSHHVTFRAVLWHVLCENSGGWGPDKWRRSFPQAFPSSFLSCLLSTVIYLQADQLVLWSWILITTLTPQRQGFQTDLVLLWKSLAGPHKADHVT